MPPSLLLTEYFSLKCKNGIWSVWSHRSCGDHKNATEKFKNPVLKIHVLQLVHKVMNAIYNTSTFPIKSRKRWAVDSEKDISTKFKNMQIAPVAEKCHIIANI